MMTSSSPIVIDDDEGDAPQQVRAVAAGAPAAGPPTTLGGAPAAATSSAANDCMICLEPYTEEGGHHPVVLRCGHHAGEPCMSEWLRKNKKCPTCRQSARPNHMVRLYGLPTVAAAAGAASASGAAPDATAAAAAAAEPTQLAVKDQMLQKVQRACHKAEEDARRAERQAEESARAARRAEQEGAEKDRAYKRLRMELEETQKAMSAMQQRQVTAAAADQRHLAELLLMAATAPVPVPMQAAAVIAPPQQQQQKQQQQLLQPPASAMLPPPPPPWPHPQPHPHPQQQAYPQYPPYPQYPQHEHGQAVTGMVHGQAVALPPSYQQQQAPPCQYAMQHQLPPRPLTHSHPMVSSGGACLPQAQQQNALGASGVLPPSQPAWPPHPGPPSVQRPWQPPSSTPGGSSSSNSSGAAAVAAVAGSGGGAQLLHPGAWGPPPPPPPPPLSPLPPPSDPMWGNFQGQSSALPHQDRQQPWSQVDGTRGAAQGTPFQTPPPQQQQQQQQLQQQVAVAHASSPSRPSQHHGSRPSHHHGPDSRFERLFSVAVEGCRLLAVDPGGCRVLVSESPGGAAGGGGGGGGGGGSCIRKISLVSPESFTRIRLPANAGIVSDLQLSAVSPSCSAAPRLAAVVTLGAGLCLVCPRSDSVVATFGGLPLKPWSCSWVPAAAPGPAGTSGSGAGNGYGSYPYDEHLLVAGLDKGSLALLDVRRPDRPVAVMAALARTERCSQLPVRTVAALPMPTHGITAAAAAAAGASGAEVASGEAEVSSGGRAGLWPTCALSCVKGAWLLVPQTGGGGGGGPSACADAQPAPALLQLDGGFGGGSSMLVESLTMHCEGGGGGGGDGCGGGVAQWRAALSWKPTGAGAGGATAAPGPRHEVGTVRADGRPPYSHEVTVCDYSRCGMQMVRSCLIPPHPQPFSHSAQRSSGGGGLMLASSDDKSCTPLIWSLGGGGSGGVAGGACLLQQLDPHPTPPLCMAAAVGGAAADCFLGCGSGSVVAVYRQRRAAA